MTLLASCMKTFSAFLLWCALASCIAPPRTEFTRANGTVAYAISCETMDDCAAKAHELCPNGHDVVPAASGASNTTDRGGIGGTPETRLLIECKASP
jgi:hypothetical protein